MKKPVSNVINGFEIKFIERNEKEKKGDVKIRFLISGTFFTQVQFCNITYSTVENLRETLNDFMRTNYTVEYQCEGISFKDMNQLLQTIVDKNKNR